MASLKTLESVPSVAENDALAMDGYWGPVTASIDWCETNYQVTPYIAE